MAPKSPPPLGRPAVAGIALAVLLTVGSIRLLADRTFPGAVPPFFLLYPAALIATLLAGWPAGFGVMGIGGLFTWTLVMHHPILRRGQPPTEEDFVNLALFAVSAGMVVAVAEVYRRWSDQQRRKASGEAESDLAMTIAESGMGVWEWRGEGPIIASAQAKAICGLPADTPVTPAAMLARVAPRHRAAAEERLARALDPDIGDLSLFEFEILTPEGERRWLAVSGHAVTHEGGGRRVVGAVVDITARKAAEEALAAAADRLHHVSEAGRLAVWQVDPKAGLIHDPDLNAVLGYPPEARLTPDDIRARYAPGELERLREITSAAWARGQRNVEVEARIRRPDGEIRWVMMRGELGLDAKGRVRAAMGVTIDITERKAAEERLNLMAQEVNHRASNLLAVVQGAVQLSEAPTPESFKAVVLGRIAAVARAHQLLLGERWEGADLARLVNEELAPFTLGESGRVVVKGPAVPLSLAAAQALALALHELSTNAAKHGSLSVPGGRVEVTWTRPRNKELTMVWRELGGPRVSVPERHGQGTALLSQALGGALDGSCAMAWKPEGLVCTLTLPAKALEWTGPKEAPPA